jgi:hypothetical protein
MRDTPTVTRTHGFFVTPEGHEALMNAGTCMCCIKLVGLLFECEECGTVYGSLRDQVDNGYAGGRKPA